MGKNEKEVISQYCQRMDVILKKMNEDNNQDPETIKKVIDFCKKHPQIVQYNL